MTTLEEAETLNPKVKWDKRKTKRVFRDLSNKLETYGYFEDCYCKPCKITDINPYRTSNPSSLYGADVEGDSLVEDGRGSSCSIYHCAPTPLTEKDALERASYYKEFGEVEYLIKYVVAPECADEVREYYKNKERDGLST